MYEVIKHRKVEKFLEKLKDKKLKERFQFVIQSLRAYPFFLPVFDVKKVKGIENTWRIRIGRHRIIFYVEKKQKRIYVTHILLRKEGTYKEL